MTGSPSSYRAICGEWILFWRTRASAVTTMSDRCAHRRGTGEPQLRQGAGARSRCGGGRRRRRPGRAGDRRHSPTCPACWIPSRSCSTSRADRARRLDL
ncbi:hypothetical protein EJK15_22535 [Nonomuraea basaltis]|nr:hypothetical protein EJK15_22535 [Nonomuraea basaltis]